ncbi:MAG TPA: cobaltochelatase subunit CobN, partial [Thermopetrobacter sp.]|nr:cobaltochelatase subunit CobN [Thermopetrobacter sp.]
LEWLPGKALALSEACFPSAVFGALPQLYPFIVNDPGEGAQAKRRTSAVIIDHLTPPMARADTYGALTDLERLVDEYYQATGMDARRAAALRRDILDLAHASGVAADAGADGAAEDDALIRLDAWLCEIKEAQIRNGLHVLGKVPEGDALAEFVAALARLPAGAERMGLTQALAADLLAGFDPLEADMAAPWDGPSPDVLAAVSDAPWRTAGDTVERLERLALDLIRAVILEDIAASDPLPPDCGGEKKVGQSLTDRKESRHPDASQDLRPQTHECVARDSGFRRNDECITEEKVRFGAGAAPSLPPPGGGEKGTGMPNTQQALRRVRDDILPRVMACGRNEMAHLLAGLAGRFVPPGPAGAPTRGRLDVLPTGRNFFSLDPRALPTPAAWRLGRKSADTMLKRHFQEHGVYPAAIGLSCWGTANMRTGGDDIAQALALIGVKPVWDHASGRVTGYEVLTLAELGRPRVDVTLRISGFFRDAFPAQIELFDKAIRAVGALEEPAADNPIATRMRREAAELRDNGLAEEDAARLAGFRVFGAKPGAYGAGLQALIDESLWRTEADLAESYINWGAYAYGATEQGERAEEGFRRRLGQLDAIAHNQDNREHDVLDSD